MEKYHLIKIEFKRILLYYSKFVFTLIYQLSINFLFSIFDCLAFALKQQQKQIFSKNVWLLINKAPYIPKMHAINSSIEIIFQSIIAITATKLGDDIAEIAVTGPAGPPVVKA